MEVMKFPAAAMMYRLTPGSEVLGIIPFRLRALRSAGLAHYVSICCESVVSCKTYALPEVRPSASGGTCQVSLLLRICV